MTPEILIDDDEELGLKDVPEGFKETTGESLKRHGKRSVGAVASSLLGLPGDVVTSVKSLGETFDEYLPDFLKSDPNFLQESAIRLSEKVPTSGDIKEEMIIKDPSMAPQNEYEELSDEMLGDFALLALPVKGKIPFFRAMGTSVFANMAKEGIKNLGGGPRLQALGKLGSMFIAGMIGRPNADKTVKKLYNKADNLLPEEAFTSGNLLEKEAANINKELSIGASTPTKEVLRKFTGDVLNNVDQSGNIPMKNVAELRRNLNEVRGDPSLLQGYAKRLNAWDKALTETAEEYGKQNPRWLTAQQEANSAFGALRKSEKAVKNIMKAVDPSTLAPHTSIALGIGGPGAAAAHLTTAGMIGSTASGYRIMQRIGTNQALRRHYMDIMKSSMEGNLKNIARDVSRFDKAMKKSLEKEPIEILDLEE